MKQVFDIRRFGFLLRVEALQNWRVAAIAASAIAGYLLLFSILGILTVGQGLDYRMWFHILMYAGGIFVASLSFTELGDKSRNEGFLLLPASLWEKYLLRLLKASLFMPLLTLFVYTIASLLAEGLTMYFSHEPFRPFWPFSRGNWPVVFRVLSSTVLLQSPFFLGAVWFKKTHMLKTLLSLAALGIIFGFVTTLALRVIFTSYFSGFRGISIDLDTFDSQPGGQYWRLIAKSMRFIAAPLCWFLAWLRLKEVQVSDGI